MFFDFVRKTNIKSFGRKRKKNFCNSKERNVVDNFFMYHKSKAINKKEVEKKDKKKL